MKINVKGAIIPNDQKWMYDWFELESTSPGDVENAIKKSMSNEELEVEINSGGGDVFSGSEIYTTLKSYTGNVKVAVVGIAASAASVIAMAGDHVEISPTAQMMIHNVSTIGRGDYRDFTHTAEILENANVSIANAYILKTGLEKDDLLDLMDNETYLNAQQAKEKGFADSIMFDDDFKLVANVAVNGMLPIEVIDKMRNDRNKEKEKGKQMAELKLLRMRGESR